MENILFIVPSLRRAGAETQIIDLVNTIDFRLYGKHLLAFEDDLSQLDKVDMNTVSFHHVRRRYKFDTGFVKDIAKIIDEQDISVIHCTMQFSLLIAFLARLHSKRKPKLVTVIHTTINRGLKEELLDRTLYNLLFRLCTAIIFVCNNQRNYWIKKYRHLLTRSSVIYNGVDTQIFDPVLFQQQGKDFRVEHGIPMEAVVVSCIAGFRPEKGHDLLISVFKKLPEDTWLLLAGDGELRSSITEDVRDSGIDDRVIFTGNLPDVRPVLAASDLTVLTSTAVETFSIAMLESMSMAVPMIASDIGGLSEAIMDDDTGRLFRAGDEEEMYSTLLRTIDEKVKIRPMGERARQLVVDKFSLDVMARETEAMLDEVTRAR